MKSRCASVSEVGKVILAATDITGLGEGQVLLRAVYSTLSPGTE